MKKSFISKITFGLFTIPFLFLLSTKNSNAQIIIYTSDTSGTLNTVALHATGTSLTRVNGALRPGTPCTHGFSNRGFTTTTTYASILPAIETDATANSSYNLNVTGFSVGIRRSSTGPANIRFAYSTDGGITWINQGTNQTPNNNATCDSMITATWATTFTVAAPNTLKFRLYGFNAGGTTGTFQIMNLVINGTVGTGSGCVAPTLSDSVFNVNCFGGNNGKVVVATTGGTSPFTYLWSNGATYATNTGLIAGTYTATVTATGGCTSTITAIVTQPATALTATTSSIVNVVCGGTTGAATAIASGGTAGYAYLWNSIPIQTTATATMLHTGTYTVIATDANSCTATSTATISIIVPSSLSATRITTSGAELNWSPISGATSYNIQYRVSGTTTWATTTSSVDSVALVGLLPSTTYEFQVKTICSSGTSAFTTSTTFTTAALATTNKFTYYFTQPVDTSVRTGTIAKFLNHCLADTLIAYFNRARYTIDIAQYEYTQGTTYSNLANAINAAYARGVRIRWIFDGAATNTGLSALNPAIHTLGSPTSSAYNIMHNKFVLIDAKSTNTIDPYVWTGSADWTSDQFNKDFNNIVIIQDSSLAHAYLAEFNMMWGDTGIAPNSSTSLFGPYKTDLGHHLFTIGGKTVELYFSPSDGTNSHILSTINTANTDLYFGRYTFSDNSDASAIMSKHSAGVYVAGIDDAYSNSYTPYTTFTSGLGSMFKVYTGTGMYPLIYHNKYLIVDPSNTCSDPLVLTGSHNWTATADIKNDENTLIIHDATAANIYYQAFKKDFDTLGGALTHITSTPGCSTIYLRDEASKSLEAVNTNDMVSIFPNPSNDKFTIAYHLDVAENVTIHITDYLGKNITVPVNNEKQEAGDQQYIFVPQLPSMYLIKMTVGNHVYNGKMIKL